MSHDIYIYGSFKSQLYSMIVVPLIQ